MSESSTPSLSPDMTMEAILEAFPSARRALFQRYHVGGCSSCAFQPTDTLSQVCKDHNLLDVNEVVEHLVRSEEVDAKMQIDPSEVKRMLDAGEEFRLIDVRGADEIALAAIQGAEPLDFADQGKYMGLPKETKLVFTCGNGERALDIAAYFAGHGFSAVWSMRGGLDGWRSQVDAALPTY